MGDYRFRGASRWTAHLMLLAVGERYLRDLELVLTLCGLSCEPLPSAAEANARAARLAATARGYSFLWQLLPERPPPGELPDLAPVLSAIGLERSWAQAEVLSTRRQGVPPGSEGGTPPAGAPPAAADGRHGREVYVVRGLPLVLGQQGCTLMDLVWDAPAVRPRGRVPVASVLRALYGRKAVRNPKRALEGVVYRLSLKTSAPWRIVVRVDDPDCLAETF